MGKTNFGGSPDLFGKNLLSILSAGMFFVPSKENLFLVPPSSDKPIMNYINSR
jgi:hypothetical protein